MEVFRLQTVSHQIIAQGLAEVRRTAIANTGILPIRDLLA